MKAPKLRFKEFTGDWIKKQIDEITIKVGSGSTPKGGEKVYQSYGIPFIRSQNVNNNYLNLEDLTYISETINKQMQGSIVKADDILLNITGASIGRSCVVPAEFKIGNVNQHVCIIRLKSGFLSRFIQPYLSSSRGQKLVLSHQVGSGREGLNFHAIRSFKIYIPDLPEQTKIANFLMAIDEKISQLTQKYDLLVQYKKGVMQQIFSQKLRFKDDDGREFPEWEEMPLSRFLIPIARKVSKPENQYLAIGIRSHFKGTFQKHDFEPEKIVMEDLYEVKPSDLIVNITFAWEGAVAIAKDEDAGGLVSHRFPTFEFNEKYVKSNFFRFAYPTNHFKYLLGLCSPGGAGRNRVLNKKDFLKIELQIPCVAEQTKIANFLTAIDGKIAQAQTQLEAVKLYKKGLLQQMFV
ncbi:MAG: restriction endonuclease subunit S [Proteobacteria bacterium]|nr:restriction endonuclease subunit S [Pseudomonadota bacterium]